MGPKALQYKEGAIVTHLPGTTRVLHGEARNIIPAMYIGLQVEREGGLVSL